jgi:predicted dehydrogenase
MRLEIPPMTVPASDLRIGIIGAGGIVRDAHLPAYQKAGWRVQAIADVRVEAAAALAGEYEIPIVLDNAAALVRHPKVDVIDLAIPEAGRNVVLAAALECRKPVLVQKPLAETLDVARHWVDRFDAAGVPLAVNMNARWAPEFRAARCLIERGVIGELFDVRWTMRNICDFQSWAKDTWYERERHFQVLNWSIHHLDLFRYWFADEPVSVFCQTPRRPGQRFVGEVMASVVLRFPSGAQATMIDSNAATPGRPIVAEVDLDGTRGSVYARVSEPRAFHVWCLNERSDEYGEAPVHSLSFEGAWYPDGFVGTMGDFLGALANDRESQVSGRRNLGTIALVDACYRSAARGEVVPLNIA